MSGISYNGAVVNMRQTPGLMTGLAAAMPAAGIKGRKYFQTDTLTIWEDTGTTWNQYLGGGGGGGDWDTSLQSGQFTGDRSYIMNSRIFELLKSPGLRAFFLNSANFDASMGDVNAVSATPVRLMANNTAGNVELQAGPFSSYINTALLTDNRDHQLPDQSGIIALTSDIPPALDMQAGIANIVAPGGATKNFTIAHTLTGANWGQLTAATAISLLSPSSSAIMLYIVSVNSTQLNIEFSQPPVAGNYRIHWEVRVV